MMKKILASLSVLFVLSGCIVVGDFGPYWDQGTVDRELVGIWVPEKTNGNEKKNYIFHDKGDHLESISNGSETKHKLRTLMIGDHKFMMYPDQNIIFKYKIEDGTLTKFMPAEDKREEFLEKHPSDHIVLTDYTVTISALNEETFAILKTVAEDPDYWKQMGQFKKAPE